jgi:hypothetical protein
MHFKTCRKASSSDDCERITGNPEVIGLSTGLVPRNALLATNPFLTRSRLVDTKRMRAQSARRMPHQCLKVFADYLLDFGSCQLRHEPVVGVREWRRVNN